MAWSFPRSVGAVARTFLRLPLSAKAEYAVVVVLAGLAEVGLRVLPLRQLARLFRVGYSTATRSSDSSQAAALQLPSWAVTRLRQVNAVMHHWPVDGACLRHSLVAGQRLRQLSPELVIGVRRTEQGAVDAHAWLRIDGVSLDPASDRFQAFPPAS